MVESTHSLYALSVTLQWIVDESPVTTHKYVEADLAMKDRPSDSVLQFLQSL